MTGGGVVGAWPEAPVLVGVAGAVLPTPCDCEVAIAGDLAW